MSIIKEVRIRALLIALFAFYVAPVLPLIILTSLPFAADSSPPTPGQRVYGWGAASGLLLILWFWALAPVGSGYFAAKLAKQQPLLHGLLTGVVGAILAVVWVQGLLVFELALALIVVSCGLFGGWLWRHRTQQNNIGL
jgi:hypothetical protein